MPKSIIDEVKGNELAALKNAIECSGEFEIVKWANEFGQSVAYIKNVVGRCGDDFKALFEKQFPHLQYGGYTLIHNRQNHKDTFKIYYIKRSAEQK